MSSYLRDITLGMAQAKLVAAGTEAEVEESVADKGYHDNGPLRWCADWSART